MNLRRAIPTLATAAILAATSLAQASAAPPDGSIGSFGSLGTGSTGPIAPAGQCPETVAPGAFPGPDELKRTNAMIAGFGLRSPGSPEHGRMVDWVENQLRVMPGMRTRSDVFPLKRWMPSPRSTTLPGRDLAAAGKLSLPASGGASEQVATAGAVPYSLPTGAAGRTAPMVYLPAGTPITAANSRGKIVIRDVQIPTIPYAVADAQASYLSSDFPHAGGYARPFNGTYAVDPTAAGVAGAAGLIVAWNVPAEQVRGYWDPHVGTHFKVPAIYVGVDEAVRLKELAGHGAEAKISVLAEAGDSTTRNLIATLPGKSKQRIIVNSHTDGATWVQENGSVALLALARYLARLPIECRPYTYEFAFTSSHLAMSTDGTHRYAEAIDKEYDSGSVAFDFSVEHMGTREILPVQRTNGPGQQLEFSGAGEPYFWFAGNESPALSNALVSAVKAHPLDRTGVVRGFDQPVVGRVPANCSFGGIGGDFHSRLIPAVAGISGAWSLWAPSFGAAAIDFNRLHQQILVVGDTLLGLQKLPNEQLAGAYPKERAARAGGAPTCPFSTPPVEAPGPQE